MMARERADLGFDTAENVFDPAEWEIGSTPPKRAEPGTARKAAEATGFRSREVPAAPLAPVPTAAAVSGAGGATRPRRRRTGRNAQFNLKARPETIQQFCAVADARGWGLGETLEQAVILLEREYGKGSGPG